MRKTAATASAGTSSGRNLFGLRKVGIGIAVAVTLASAALLPSFSGRMTITILGLVLALAVALAPLVLWTWLVTPKWVRKPAEAYAERLLLSADRR